MGKHLDRLADWQHGRIFSIKKKSDGKFWITEGCDNYFSLPFTADELRELGEEIVELSKT